MFSIELDIRTLSWITVLFSFVFGTGLVSFGLAHGVFSGLKRVGAGMLLIGLGFLLIGYRHHIPVALSVVAANTALVLGFMLINVGIRSFRQISRADFWPGVVVVLFNLFAMFYLTYISPSFQLRVFVVCMALLVFSGMCCRNSLRDSSANHIIPQRILAWGFALFGVYMFARGLWVLNESAMQDFMTASTIHGLAFLAMILLLVSVTFGLIWMANDFLLQELRQYEQVILAMPEGVALVDRDGRYQLVNDAILRFVGLSRQEMLGKNSLELFGRSLYEATTLPNLQKAFAGKAGVASTWITLPSGEKMYATITYYPVPDARGENMYAAIHLKNITDLYHAQKDKQRIFDLSLDLFSVGGMDGDFKEVNPAWSRVLGWSEEELLSRSWLDFTHPEDREVSSGAMSRLAEGKPVMDFVNRVRTKEGTFKHISWMTHPDRDAQLTYSVGRDVSERILMEEELRELATKDPLTGADNRRVFMQRLNEEISRSARYETPLCLFMLDIDHFKNVNDTYGHAIGDKVIKFCVEVCTQTLRSTDDFGRIGGEEFAAALPHTDLETGLETAERLRENLSQGVLETDSGPVTFTVSVGVAMLMAGESVEDFLKRADDALYRAKRGGRNRVEQG